MTARLFVLGGARSGKSGYAERAVRGMAEAAEAEKLYIATAQAFDAEMTARIAQHKRDRGPGWTTIEAPRELPELLRAEAGAGRVVLVDCLTLWLSNELLAEADLEARAEALDAALAGAEAEIVLVSNEVGLSVVPDNALARRFRDAQGRLNQRVAARAAAAVFMAAGLPIILKGAPP